MEKDLSSQITALFLSPHPQDLQEAFTHFFAFVYERQAFYRVYMNKSTHFHFIEALMPDEEKERPRQIGRMLGYHTHSEYLYHTAFFKAGLSAMIREWLNAGCPESPREMTDILQREYAPKPIQL